MDPDVDLHTLVIGREAMACRFELVFNTGEVPQATELAVSALEDNLRIDRRRIRCCDWVACALLGISSAAGPHAIGGATFAGSGNRGDATGRTR